MSGRRVLVAGGAGFVGSHLCDALVQAGDEVLVVDSFVTGSRGNLAHLAGRVGVIEQDVVEPLEVDGPLDAVLHLASPASPADYLGHPLLTLRTGSAGTERLLELALAKEATFLLASTSEVYGDPAEHPQREAYWGNVNPIGPRSVYNEAKRYAEALTMAYHRELGLDVRIARIFNTYGPRLRPSDGRVVPSFITQALRGEPLTIHGDGSQTRSFCYVQDLVGGLLALLDGPITGPINLGNPQETTVADLAALVLELTGSRSTLVHQPRPVDDPPRRRPDISLAHRHLGWCPETDLRTGLACTISWYARA